MKIDNYKIKDNDYTLHSFYYLDTSKFELENVHKWNYAFHTAIICILIYIYANAQKKD